MICAIIKKKMNKTVRNHPVYNLKLRNVYCDEATFLVASFLVRVDICAFSKM